MKAPLIRVGLQTIERILFLVLLSLASLLSTGLPVVHASGVNIVRNPSFENQLEDWLLWTDHIAPGSTVTTNTNRQVDGSYSARLEMERCPCRLITGEFTSPVGFIALYQIFPLSTFFGNLSDRPDTLDFWFYLEPKFDGMGDFRIIFFSQNSREMDYVFDADPRLSYPNQTFPDGRPMVKIIKLPGYPPGQWHRFTRNLKADWQAPLRLSNGTLLPGYGLNETLSRIQFDALGFQIREQQIAGPVPAVGSPLNDDVRLKYVDTNGDNRWTLGESVIYDGDSDGSYDADELVIVGTIPSLGASLKVDSRIKFADDNGNNIWNSGEAVVYDSNDDGVYGTSYSVRAWVDDVKVYVDTDTPPPPRTHWAIFNFTDANGSIIDEKVKWKLFNSTGQEVPYNLGQSSLPDGSYTVEVYYPTYTGQTPEPYRIHSQTIPLDASSRVTLNMIPHNSASDGYFALDSPTVTLSLVRQDESILSFATQAAPESIYAIIIKVPTQPVLVQKNNMDYAAWSYDSSKSTLRMPTVGPGAFSLFFQTPFRVPTIRLLDRTGQPVDDKVTFRILDSQSNWVTYLPGMALPDDNYLLEVHYEGFRIYRQSLDRSETVSIALQMTPLTILHEGFLVTNSTETPIGLIEENSQRITFRVDGSTSSLVIAKVPRKPLFVEKDGARILWLYNDTSRTVYFEAMPGTFSIVFGRESSASFNLYAPLNLIVAGLTLAIFAIITGLVWSKRARPRIASSSGT